MDIFESTEIVGDPASSMTSSPPVIMAYVDDNAQNVTAGKGHVAGANSVSLADFVDDNANDEALIRLIDTGRAWDLEEIPDTTSTTAPMTNVDVYFEWLKNQNRHGYQQRTRLRRRPPIHWKRYKVRHHSSQHRHQQQRHWSVVLILLKGFDWDDYINWMIPEPPTITSTTSPNAEELESYDWNNMIAQMVPADWSGFNWASSYLSDDEVLRNFGDWCCSLDEW